MTSRRRFAGWLVMLMVLVSGTMWAQTAGGQKPPRPRNPALDRILAAELGDTPEVQTLLAGSDPNARDAGRKRTALMWSIIRHDQAAFRRFMSAGADVNAIDAKGGTPLGIAVEFMLKHDTTAMAEALIANGANVSGSTPMEGAMLLVQVANANASGIARAILAKADPKVIDTSTSEGLTPLIAAASVGARDVAWLLIEKGAGIDLYDLQGRTPLIHAASRQFPGTLETVKLLLEMGANPAARDKDGKTALSEAQQRGSAEVVALLKKAGAQ